MLLRVIELLDRLGDRAGAIREYEAFAKRLREDYEAEPAPETTALIVAVRAREQAKQPACYRVHRWRNSLSTRRSRVSRPNHALPGALVVVRRLRSWLLVATLAVAAATVLRNGRGDDVPVLDPTRVLVDIFQNETGDPSLDPLGRIATDQVTAGLTYYHLRRRREPRHAAAVARAGRYRREFDWKHPTDLQALARANGTGTVVWGSYYLQSDSLHFLAHVTNAATGEELATIEPVRGPVDAPLAAVERLRDRVMTTLATLTDPRLAKWMRYASKPPTFEAYQAFVEGIELYATNGNPFVAAAQFVRAAALDSTFTMPLLWAINTGTYTNSVADSIAQELNRRREQLAPLDRRLLDYLLARLRLDHWRALGAIRRVVEIAPNSEYLHLAAQTAMQLNRPRLAIEFLMQGDPKSGWLRGKSTYWDGLAVAYHMLADHRQELEEVHRGQSQLPDRSAILWQEMRALAALGRTEQLNARIQEINLSPHGYLMERSAWELRVHGYGDAATEMLHRAVEWFEGRSPEQKRAPGERRQLAAVFLDLGRLDEAQVVLEGLLEDYPESYANLAQLGVVAARRGDREEASRISRLLEEGDRSPMTPLQASQISAYQRAGIAAALGERGRAMQLLRQSGPRLFDYPIFRVHADPNLEPLWDLPTVPGVAAAQGVVRRGSGPSRAQLGGVLLTGCWTLRSARTTDRSHLLSAPAVGYNARSDVYVCSDREYT